MLLSNPNTLPAESPQRRTSKLDGMTLAQKADWVAKQAIIGLNRARLEALAKKAHKTAEPALAK